MSVTRELKRELLRPLKAEVPIDDGKRHHVVLPAGQGGH
jgi:hypothetical protein